MGVPVKRGSPPSSYAMADFIEGHPGALPRVIAGTASRALIMVPGLALAGVKPPRLFNAAVLGSVGISTFLWLMYSSKARQR